MGVGQTVGAGLQTVGGVFMPMLSASRDARRMHPALRWTLHILALALVVGLLWFVQYWFDLDRRLKLPHPALRGLWLPLIFLLLYALGWVGRWLWNLLGPEQESSMFPDIERAWREAVRALDQAGIDLTASPLFLVLGRPSRGEESLFQGVQPRLMVTGAPRGADAPLRVYANRDGIYVTCPGASLLARQVGLLAEEGFVAPEGTSGEFTAGDAAQTLGNFGTLRQTGQVGAEAIQQIIDRARGMGRGVDQLLEEERRAIGQIIASQDEAESAANDPRGSMLRDQAELETQALRLRAVCRQIARERRPYCPINGILLVFPIAATQSDSATTQAGLVARRDLDTVRDALHVRCPVFALISDLETLRGFRELTARLPQDQRDRRMGQRFPLKPDADPATFGAMFNGGIQQVGNRLIPNLVSNLWRAESPGGESMAEAVRGNIELYHLLDGIRGRQARIARLIARSALSDAGPPAPVGGCYLAATGPDPAREQAFIPGVFRRLVESQDFVSWTPEALAEDRGFFRWARLGYIALGLLTTATIGLVLFLFVFRGNSPPSGSP